MDYNKEIDHAKTDFYRWLEERAQVALDQLLFKETMRLAMECNIIIIRGNKTTTK